MAFIGEIQIFGFGYAPPGWLACDGAELNIRDYTALFSLISNSYGGDGVTRFRVPNLAGRAACGQGTGPGLTPRKTGDTFGVNNVALSAKQAPAHSHGLNFFSIQKTTDPDSGQEIDHRVTTPETGYSLALPDTKIFAKAKADANMLNSMVALEGGADSHENRQPFGALTYFIMARSAFGGDIFPVFD